MADWRDVPVATAEETLYSDWTEVPKARKAEIREDTTPGWQKFMSENLPAIGETVGAITGGMAGVAASAPVIGPWAPAAGVAGAAGGGATGRRLGQDINQWLGVPETLEPGKRRMSPLEDTLSAAQRSAAFEMGGQMIAPVLSTLGRVPNAFPSYKIRAGEIINESRTLYPLEAASAKKQAEKLRKARESLGVERMPEGSLPGINRESLTRNRKSQSGNVMASETQLDKVAREQAERGLNRAIPEPNAEQVNRVNQKLEDVTSRQRDAAQRIKDLKQEAAEAQARGAEEQAVALQSRVKELETQFDQNFRVQPAGEAVQARFGKEAELGPRFVRQKFKELYEPFDANPQAVAPTDNFANIISQASKASRESGLVLRNYVREGDTVQRLMADVTDEGGQMVGEFPEVFPLATWRNLKGELAQAAETAARTGDNQAAMVLGDMSRAARAGEDAAAARLGTEQASKYAQVRDAYRRLYVDGFRRGFIGTELLKPGGKQIGGEATQSAQVLKKLTNLDNADSLMHALGAEKVVAQGRTLENLSAKEIQALGREEARNIVEPYIKNEMWTKYLQRDGGEAGAKAIDKYIRLNQELLEKYGINPANIRKAVMDVKAVGKDVAQMSGVSQQVQADLVEQTLKVTDPYKVPQAILTSPNPRVSLVEIFNVSKTPEWRNSIKGLMKKNLQDRVKAGEDIFKNPKIRQVLPAMYSKNEIRKLREFHTIMRQLDRPSTAVKAGAEFENALLSTGLRSLESAPTGLQIAWYASKQAVVKFVRHFVSAEERTVAAYVDRAWVDGEKAAELVSLFKNSKYGQAKMDTAVLRDFRTKLLKIDQEFSKVAKAGKALTYATSYPMRKDPDTATTDDYIRRMDEEK